MFGTTVSSSAAVSYNYCTVLGERDDFLKYREDLCDLGVGFIEINN